MFCKALTQRKDGKLDMMWDREIDISEIEGVYVGNAQDDEAKTGVTAIIIPEGAALGCKISGGGPASRETGLTYSETAENGVHAIVLSGGSAFGLAASQGVMAYLEKEGIGFPTPFGIVPLVCQSCLYDLNYGRADVRPDPAMGEEACRNAMAGKPLSMGNVGAGTGASVGKLKTMREADKTGLGIFAASLGDLKMAAIVAVNALGDVYDPSNGEKIAGLRTSDRTAFVDTEDCMAELYRDAANQTAAGADGEAESGQRTNTTIGAIITNAKFTKAQMNKIAAMATNAYARCIRPVATMADGDTVYAASAGDLTVDINLAGSFAAQVMQQAIIRSVTSAKISDEELFANIVE